MVHPFSLQLTARAATIPPYHTPHTDISQSVYSPNQGSEAPAKWHQTPSSEPLSSVRSRLTDMFGQIFEQVFMAELHLFPSNLFPSDLHPPVFGFIAYDARTITDALMGIRAIDGARASHWIDPARYNALVVRMRDAYCGWFGLRDACLGEWHLWVFNKGRFVSSYQV
jgi:hypothetical protein